MSGILTILFLFLMFMGMPVAFAIGISAVMFYLFGPVPPMIAIQKITTVTSLSLCSRYRCSFLPGT